MPIFYGGDYNPEQWPSDVWADDVRLMREAGVNLATVGVFSWARIQPAEGVFDYAWLDQVIDLLHEAGIAVDLATGTASPPPWLTAKYPAVLTENADGVTRWPGSRQHYAPTSPDYRRLASELVRTTVERYKNHPAVVLWHINNELGCHVAYDYSDQAAAAFRDWLRAKHGDVDALNAAWGTMFWSQRYTDFEEILPPRHAPYSVNPGQVLDFRRFSSDMLLELLRMEKRIIREAGAAQPLTTNMMSAFQPTDYWAWADEVDVIADDTYPDPRDPLSYQVGAFARDLMRSLKPGRPWILMEQAPNYVNWRDNNAAKAPGQMAAMSMQAVGRGADGVLFFQWRQSSAGAEKYHSAMLPHGGPHTRTFREISRLGAELAELGDLPAPGGEAAVAIVLDWDSWWALDQPNHPAPLDYIAQVRAWHSAFLQAGVQTDFVRAAGPFDGYRLVVAPSLHLAPTFDALTAYVDGGGHLLTTAFTDIVDEHDRFLPGGFTRRLGPVLGASVLDFAGVQPGEATVHGDGLRFEGTVVAEVLHVEGASVLATFGDGSPALVRHPYGAGSSYHLATIADEAGTAALTAHVVDALDLRPVVANLPPHVEACARGPMLTLINHNPTPVEVDGHILQPHGYRITKP
ncbi:beta-galactosidase [Paractinoplanes abujensis]|uniref:Beta-galactosidase n=1 Tax=Paractinoplanes abujensis TaxID=882441 RepID=A0A7W7FZH4_9ACTN|nr:beta-galactosidase [Actinoplanes abujensis]MBB4690579.1 beta-galactosidase [Actinoplanes abujensis]GID18007.1 beta-galactosidase [Actinoplanes abujensis]